MLDNLHITEDWTLFLDRDGVINHEKKRTIFGIGLNSDFMKKV